jgi:hypothetical protein
MSVEPHESDHGMCAVIERAGAVKVPGVGKSRRE